MPGRTGPRSAVGKRRASLNRLGHGLRVSGILPCRLDSCYYREICAVPEMAPDRWAQQRFGDPCISEADYVKEWKEHDIGPGLFNKDSAEEMALLDELIAADLLRTRAAHAQLLLAKDNSQAPRIVAYYDRRHWRHIMKVHFKMLPYYRGFIAVARYKKKLIADYADLKRRAVENASTSTHVTT